MKRLRGYGETAIELLGGEPERPALVLAEAGEGALLEFPVDPGAEADSEERQGEE